MSKFRLGETVIISDGFYSTKEAVEVARLNDHNNWVPRGIIKKIPSKNDKISYDNGDEWAIKDNYNVELFINPHIKKKDTVIITYLEEKDIKYDSLEN